jgi:hypothetical protein
MYMCQPLPLHRVTEATFVHVSTVYLHALVLGNTLECTFADSTISET